MILNASYVCLHAFSLRRESPDPDPRRRTPHFWGGSVTIFAWKLADNAGVPRELIEHELHLDPKAKPIKQWFRNFTQDKKDVIKREIARLLDVDFIKEVCHPDWLINPVLVPKKNKDWRMCVDYTDLNKACKKDPVGMPRIDQVVDSMAGYHHIPLHCYLGYHHIPLKE